MIQIRHMSPKFERLHKIRQRLAGYEKNEVLRQLLLRVLFRVLRTIHRCTIYQ
jgi:hypothetical protein